MREKKCTCPECGMKFPPLETWFVNCHIHGKSLSLEELQSLCEDPFLEPFEVAIARILGRRGEPVLLGPGR